MPRTVPGVGTILGIVEERLEERRLDALQVAFRLAHDMAGDKFRRILEHVDEAVQFAQDIVRDMTAGLGLAIDVDRHVGVLPTHFLNEIAQIEHRRVEVGPRGEFLVVDGKHESAGPRLLLRELRQIAVAGRSKNLKFFIFNGLRDRTYAETGRIFGPEIFIDNDDWKAELHEYVLAG